MPTEKGSPILSYPSDFPIRDVKDGHHGGYYSGLHACASKENHFSVILTLSTIYLQITCSALKTKKIRSDFGSPGHASLLKVGQLFDAYLAEIAPDPYLPLHKFLDMVEMLPDYAQVMDDGL
ncbi:hypothetical protein ACFE04_000956 [Oxalis oulophora]